MDTKLGPAMRLFADMGGDVTLATPPATGSGSRLGSVVVILAGSSPNSSWP
jgi:hypothetical protein